MKDIIQVVKSPNIIWIRFIEQWKNEADFKPNCTPEEEDITVITWSIPEETTMLQKSFEKMGMGKELIVIPITKPFNWLDKITKTNEYLKKVRTKYALILNPDTTLTTTALTNFIKASEQIPDFAIMAPYI